MSKTVHDRSNDGLLEIADINIGPDGVLRVTVRELVGSGCWKGGLPIRRMRSLARSIATNPKEIRSSRVISTHTYSGCDYVTFAISKVAL